MATYRYLGWGETNENGIARLSKNANNQDIDGYTGQGIGKVDIVVSLDNPIVEGMSLQETYEVCDSLMFDSGILNDPQRNTNDWLNWNNYLTVTADANGTLLTNTSANSGYIYLFKHGHTSSDFYVWDYGSCIEFDLVDCSDLTKCYLQIVASGSGEIIFGNENLSTMGITVGSHIKVDVTSSRATVYVDGVEKYHKDHSYSNLFRIDVAIVSGYTFKFRNLRVYPI